MTREPLLGVLESWILCAAIVRGLFLIDDPDLMIVHLGWPGAVQPAWGAMVVALGVIGLIGQAWTKWGKFPYRWVPSLAAHAALTGAYLVFSLAAFNYAAMQSNHNAYTAAFEILGYVLCHWIFANRSRSVL